MCELFSNVNEQKRIFPAAVLPEWKNIKKAEKPVLVAKLKF